jgi:pilus assembly protein CpaE
MRVIIAGVMEGMRERYRQTVLGIGLECEADDCVSYAELPFRILHGPADLIILRLGSNPTTALPLLRETATQTKTPIVAIGSSSDAEYILRALRSGAREYFHETDLGAGLLATLGRMRQAGVPAIEWGQIIAVIAAKPGIGGTTVACNLAFALASHYPDRVALAELGSQVPELALDLDVHPPHNLNDLAIREGRLDTTLLRQLVVEHQAHLHLLVHSPTTLQAATLPPAVMRTVLVLLRTMYENTVVDLGHSIDLAGLAALELANKVVVVVGLDVPTLRLSRRFLRDVENAGVGSKNLVVVANRYGQKNQFPWKNAQEALGYPIQEWIPDDIALVNRALNLGQPLLVVSRGASITRIFDQLANRFNGKTKSLAV